MDVVEILLREEVGGGGESYWEWVTWRSRRRLQEGNGVKEVATRVVESGKNWVGICT
jgi:hypothetical protein